MSPSFRLDGKVALVTGASRGLGAGIADALKEAGATVVGTSRKQDSAEQVAKRLDSVPVAMDVSDVPRCGQASTAWLPNSDGWTSWSTTPV